MNCAAFRYEIPTDNNSLQVPMSRMPPNDLMDWPHKGSVTVSLLPGLSSPEDGRLCRAVRQSSSLKNKKVQTRKLLGLHITSQHKYCESS